MKTKIKRAYQGKGASAHNTGKRSLVLRDARNSESAIWIHKHMPGRRRTNNADIRLGRSRHHKGILVSDSKASTFTEDKEYWTVPCCAFLLFKQNS